MNYRSIQSNQNLYRHFCGNQYSDSNVFMEKQKTRINKIIWRRRKLEKPHDLILSLTIKPPWSTQCGAGQRTAMVLKPAHTAHGSQGSDFQQFYKLVAWNCVLWKYLKNKMQQTLQIRTPPPTPRLLPLPPSPVLKHLLAHLSI